MKLLSIAVATFSNESRITEGWAFSRTRALLVGIDQKTVFGKIYHRFNDQNLLIEDGFLKKSFCLSIDRQPKKNQNRVCIAVSVEVDDGAVLGLIPSRDAFVFIPPSPKRDGSMSVTVFNISVDQDIIKTTPLLLFDVYKHGSLIMTVWLSKSKNDQYTLIKKNYEPKKLKEHVPVQVDNWFVGLKKILGFK